MRFREEVAGLADGAGINRGMAELANLFPEMFHCNGFALFGKATKDGKLIHGRLLDYMVGSGLQNYGIVIVAGRWAATRRSWAVMPGLSVV